MLNDTKAAAGRKICGCFLCISHGFFCCAAVGGISHGFFAARRWWDFTQISQISLRGIFVSAVVEISHRFHRFHRFLAADFFALQRLSGRISASRRPGGGFVS